MIDTLMAIWNRGYGGRGILVSLAFLVICISISLLLVTVGNFWTGLWTHHVPPVNRSDTLSASLTATAGSQLKVATPGGTPLVYSPTSTPTTNPCVLTPTTGKASHVLSSPTGQHGSGHTSSPTPTPHPRPTITATPRPRPTNTPVPTSTPSATPTVAPTATATATSTPSPTPSPSPTLTPSPTPSPTATVTDTPTPPPETPTTTPPTVTPTATPTIAVTATVPTRRRGGTPVPTPGTTATPGHNKIVGGKSCSSVYSGSGDSVGMTFDGSVGAILVRNLWIILGGSTLGTCLFYITIYLLNRKRMQERKE